MSHDVTYLGLVRFSESAFTKKDPQDEVLELIRDAEYRTS